MEESVLELPVPQPYLEKNMKRPVLLAATAALMLLTAPCSTNAQGGPPGGPGQGGASPQQTDPQVEANRKAEQDLALKNRKAEMELRIAHQMDELEKSKSCIAAAATMEDLRKCTPMRTRGGMTGMGMMGARGGQMMGGPGGGMQPPPGGEPGSGPQ